MNKNLDIYYLGHSGFAVDTKKSMLVFDFWDLGKRLLDPILDLKDRKIYFFNSHSHHDHYDPEIERYKRSAHVENHFIGWKGRDNRHIYVPPRKSYHSDNIRVTTVQSNDSGVAFHVDVDDVGILHGGDLAGWDDEPWDSFSNEIDFIKARELKVDVAFLAVSTFSGELLPEMKKGAKYLIETLDPGYFIPMHANSREYLYREFKKENYPEDQRVVCPEYPGQKLELQL